MTDGQTEHTDDSSRLEGSRYTTLERLNEDAWVVNVRVEDESGGYFQGRLLKEPVSVDDQQIKTRLQALQNSNIEGLNSYLDFIEDEGFLIGWIEPEIQSESLFEYLQRIRSKQNSLTPQFLAELKRLMGQLIQSLEALHRLDIPYGPLQIQNLRVRDGDLLGLYWGLGSILGREKPKLNDKHRDLQAFGRIIYQLVVGAEFVEDHPESFEVVPSELLAQRPELPAIWIDVLARFGSEASPSLEALKKQLHVAETSPGLPLADVEDIDSISVTGRTKKQQQLVEHLRRTGRRNELEIGFLGGAQGIGKSRLTKWIKHWARQRGWIVFEGRFRPDLELIFQGWNRIWKELIESVKKLQEFSDCGGFESGILELGRFLGNDISPEGRPAQNWEARVRAVRDVLRRLTENRPVLFVFEDLHWCQEDSKRFFLDLFAGGEDLRSFVVATWNESKAVEESRELARRLSSLPVKLFRYELAPLDKAEASELLGVLKPEMSEVQRDQIVELSQGSPFLLKELSRQLNRFDDGYLEQLQPDERPKVLVSERFDKLPKKQAFVVRLITLSGVGLPLDIVESALKDEFGGMTDYRTCEQLLAEVVESGFAVESSNRFWDHVYQLRNEFFRLGILTEIREPRKQHLYELLADAFQKCFPQYIELRIQYLDQANQRHKAIDWVVEVAGAAERQGAYKRAIKLWQFLQEEADRGTVELPTRPVRKLATLSAKAADYEAAVDLRRLVLETNENGGSQGLSLLVDDFENRIRLLQFEEARDVLNKALDTYGEGTETGPVSGRIKAFRDKIEAAFLRWSRQKDWDGESGDSDFDRIRTYVTLLTHSPLFGHSISPIPFRDRLARMAEESGNPEILGYERLFLADFQKSVDVLRRPRRVNKWYEDAEGFFRKPEEIPKGLTLLFQSRAELCIGFAEFDRAERFIQEARRSAFHAPEDFVHPELNHYLESRLAMFRGQFERAEKRALQMISLYRGNDFAVFRAYQALVEMKLLTGDLDRAEYYLDRIRRLIASAPLSSEMIWLARMMTYFNLGHGRADVVLGKLDILEERLRDKGLFRRLEFKIPYYTMRCQAGCFKVSREKRLGIGSPEKLLDEMKTYKGRLQRFSDKLVPVRRAELFRTIAHCEWIEGEPDRAMAYLDKGIEAVSKAYSPVIQAKSLRARGLIIASTNRAEGDELIERADHLCQSFGLFQPLVLEGWPASSEAIC